VFAREGDHPLVNGTHDRRAQDDADLAHRLGIRHLGGANMDELTVDQIGADLALEGRVAPVAHVLEHQQPQHDVGRCALAPERAAMPPATCQRLVDQLQQLRVVQ